MVIEKHVVIEKRVVVEKRVIIEKRISFKKKIERVNQAAFLNRDFRKAITQEADCETIP